MKRAALLLFLVAGCAKEEDPLALLLNDSVRSALEAPESVKLLRLHPGPYPKSDKKIESYVDVPTTAEVSADPETAKELSALLLNRASYADIGKGCIPTPGVKVQFKRKSAVIEGYLCFECLMIAYSGPGAPGIGFWVDFDPSATALKRIAKKSFPNDSVIQSLK